VNFDGSEQLQKALRKAVRLLRHSDKTEKEMVERLTADGHTDQTTQLTVSSLKDQGLLDDKRVASRAVEKAMTDKPKGRLLVEFELKNRGIDDNVIQSALTDLESQSELERAESLLKKRYSPGDSLQRSGSFLIRKGFEEDVVNSAIERVHLDAGNIPDSN